MLDINTIPRLPQRQDAFADQIADLIRVAERLGMYDAADWLKARAAEHRTPTEPMSPVEAFAKLREASQGRWDGVDAIEHVRELRED